MQARRPSTPPPSLPSQSITTILQDSEAQLPDAENSGAVVKSPAQASWATPSPTQTLGHSSPELPALPSLASLGGIPRTPPEGRVPAEDYYTASWGSPYSRPRPSSVSGKAVQQGSDPVTGSDADDDSGLHFGLDHLLPSRLPEEISPDLQFGLEHLLPSRLLGAQVTPSLGHYQSPEDRVEHTPRPSAQHPTGFPPENLPEGPAKNWFRQLLAGASSSEKASWWSDDSQSEHSEPSSDKESAVARGQGKKGHRSTKTLKQEDFWTYFSKPAQKRIAKMMSSRFAFAGSPIKPGERTPDHRTPEHHQSTPLSPVAGRSPLANMSPLNSPSRRPGSMRGTTDSPDTRPLSVPQTPQRPNSIPPSPMASARRVRRKLLSKKGKACWIDLPADIERGTPGNPPRVLAPEEVQERLRRFEEAGYDTRGFGHWRGADEIHDPADYAQNRDIYPDPAELREEMSKKAYKVHIPNEAEWKAYQQHLLELKLAALGVSLGGEEEQQQPTDPSPMSRQTSGQYPPLPFSPPIPSSSTGSLHRANGSIALGAVGRGPSPGHLSRGSVASPLSAFGNPRGPGHMHRHSTFTSPSSFAGQPTPPGLAAWSPHQYFGPQGSARGGSPSLGISLPNSRPDLNDLMSPSSPFAISPAQSLQYSQKEEFLAHMQQQQQQLQAQLLQSQGILAGAGVRPPSTLAEVPEDEAEEEEVLPQPPQQIKRSQTDIAVPTPRGHRHNISQNLERGVQDADYHLEKEIDRQLDEGGQFSPGVSRFGLQNSHNKPTPVAASAPWEQPRGVDQVLHHPQPHARAHSLTQTQNNADDLEDVELSDGEKTNVSDGTNPSLDEIKRGTAHSNRTSIGSSAWKPNHGSRTSKASLSTLNADAKEFKFNPGASFKPSGFTFTGFGSQPNSASSFTSTFPSAVTQSFPPASQPKHTASGSAGGFNFDAPSFQPGKTFTASSVPSSDFSFSPMSSSFKPDAPAFQPSFASPAQSSVTSPTAANTSTQSSIFGNVNLTQQEMVKPAKRSKAIPIVRPDVTLQKPVEQVEEDKEDADGRITQSDARQKRARRGGDDGDQVPLFASPAQPLGEVKEGQTVKQEPQIERSPALEGKENLVPAAADDKPKEEVKASPAPENAPEQALEASRDEESDRESVVTPVASRIDRRSPTEQDTIILTKDEASSKPSFHKHTSTGSLSATAKPFEPRFGTGFNFGIHVTKPSTDVHHDVDNNIINTPPRNFSQSPAHTFRTDGSYRTAPEPRKHPRYPDSESLDYDSLAQPSFNEIDEVMKHMNEEGSDFGVERDDEQSWEQSSQRRSMGEMEHVDLRPPMMHLRSDAPSPSPRRVYPPPPLRRHGSGGSLTQDPFDDRAGLAYESPVHRLNNADDVPVSDWDDVISAHDEEKLHSRKAFFDSHVDRLINNVLQSRLGPMEENLRLIQDSLAGMALRGGRSGRRGYSTDRQESDADDEDDEVEDPRFRNRSPIKDRRLEKIRAIVADALATHYEQHPPVPAAPAPAVSETQGLDPTEFYQALADLKVSIAEQKQRELSVPSSPKPNDVEEIYRAIADMKAQLAENLNNALSAPAPAPAVSPSLDMTEFYQAFADMKISLAKAASQHVQLDDFKEMMEEALNRQREMTERKHETFKEVMKEALARQGEAIERGRDDFKQVMEEAMTRQIAIGVQNKEELREIVDEAIAKQDALQYKIRESTALAENEGRAGELEVMLKEASLRLDQEVEARKALEKRDSETERLLRLAEEEIALLKVAVRDEENKNKLMGEELHVAKHNIEAHKAAQDDLRKKLDAFANENEVLQATLQEYRTSSNKWRDEIHQANVEKEAMKRNADALKQQIAEAVRIREVMRGKLDKLQQDMVAAAGSIAAEKSAWQKTDEEHRTRFEVLRARAEAEARTRERLEREMERLEIQEREGMKLRVVLEQTQHANARLEETVNALRLESQEHQKTAARYEREFREAREAGRIEVQRTRMLLEADVERANHEVNLVRADLEAEVNRVRTELDNVRLDADTAKARHELILEEESDKKKAALQEALEGRKAALQDLQERHQHRMEDLRHQHSRDLRNAQEDRERIEKHLAEKLQLAQTKIDYLEDKNKHLEEHLAVSKAAAQAAVQAAKQSAKAPAATAFASARSGLPEKISPQALRESIAVLQEQLQERETRIESLEHELSEVDREAPTKLKERDTEIGWLRELLGVRVDDLNDLITALAQPHFDRETVRDAAIRLRANLQMEQQEKERSSGGSFPSLSALSNLATPKAAQLAAAIGNWRRGTGRDSRAGSVASSVVRPQSQSYGYARAHTPSKAPSVAGYSPMTAQNFLSGLMTPPASNVRRPSPQPESAQATPRVSAPHAEQPSAFHATGRRLNSSKQAEIPSTPPLLRHTSYDQDAESANDYFDDEDSTMMEGPIEEPPALERGWEFAASPRAV